MDKQRHDREAEREEVKRLTHRVPNGHAVVQACQAVEQPRAVPTRHHGSDVLVRHDGLAKRRRQGERKVGADEIVKGVQRVVVICQVDVRQGRPHQRSDVPVHHWAVLLRCASATAHREVLQPGFDGILLACPLAQAPEDDEAHDEGDDIQHLWEVDVHIHDQGQDVPDPTQEQDHDQDCRADDRYHRHSVVCMERQESSYFVHSPKLL
mmetsp:Transcript_21836/g.60792  ORF Transcript_21836/g.60792 Transcript_21836/m.60792 type:complete len:209 (-) Transcript_21836:185-811(-)